MEFPFGFAALPCPIRSEPQRPFVMVTDQPETTYEGKWQRLAYQEAFKRLGVPLEVDLMPTQRVSAMVDSGAVDGQFMRVLAYADMHPEQVRVDEPIYEVGFALWTSNPAALSLSRLQDLAATSWIGVYKRGVELCQRSLSPLAPAERLSSVATEEIGLRMLLTGRVDYYCEIDAALQSALYSPEFKGVSVRPLLTIGDRIMLYPYLYKKHAELAPRLVAVLKAMKAEGLLERFRHEALGN
jgi:polar amino acid transport system substrate-binding protein